jgi:hypothetical protein
MKFVELARLADPDVAALKLVEIANSVEPVQDGRIYIELSNAPFLYEHKGSPAEYKAGSGSRRRAGLAGAVRIRDLREVYADGRGVVRLMAGPAISRVALTIALLFVCSSGSSHAQECTLQSDQYIGVLTNDGRCFPWRKRLENLIAGLPRCKPDLKGRLESPLLPEIVNGEFSSTKECVPIELLRRSTPPRPTSLDDNATKH